MLRNCKVLLVIIMNLKCDYTLTTDYPREINIALLAEYERSPKQWEAIVEWAQRLIRRDDLIPADYAIKYV